MTNLIPKKVMYNPELFIFAGEASGDLFGKELLHSLREHSPSLSFFGVGGKEMKSEGMECLLPMETFQVMGFFDIFFHLPSLFTSFFFLRKKILERNPSLVLFIDYPGFSLRLEKSLRKGGYQGTIVHCIAPSVWAWGKKRISLLEKNIDLLLTIFPFEKKYFNPHHLQVEYIGHPLVNKIEPPVRKKNTPKNFIGIFPGSRKKEILRNLPLQLETMQILFRKDPSLSFYISIADTQWQTLLLSMAKKYKDELQEHLLFSSREEQKTFMNTTRFAIAKSGTITLELALHEIPTIVIYAIKPWDLFLLRHIIKIDLPHYCIVNILMEQEIFPELYGPNLTREKLLFWSMEFLEKKDLLQEKQKACKALRHHLTKDHIPQNGAELILATRKMEHP